MKFELEHSDVKLIADHIFEMLRPIMTPIDPKTITDILDVQELAEYLKVESSWVYKQIQFKSIPHFHAGKYPCFKRKEIDAWITEQSTQTVRAPYPKYRAR